MRYYLVAGERSGDLHGSNLVKAIRRHDSDAVLRGFGGEYMQKAGVELAVHYSAMSFMGLVELLFNINKISKFIKICKRDIDQFKPDVVILIDYGGFNRRIAKYGKKNGIKVFYYIPPKVWAWYQSRAKELKENVDQLFVILPFEKEFYKKFDWEVNYVGNPVLDAIKSFTPNPDFISQEGLKTDRPIIALLPGSRKQELIKIVPVMCEVVKRYPEWQFVLASVDNLPADLYETFTSLPNVKMVTDKTYDILSNATAAIVTSGTATLETAIFKVPQVVVYKANTVSYGLAKMVVKVKFISLVNLISGEETVKELIQSECNVENISSQLDQLVVQGEKRNNVMTGYEKIIALLDAGGSASENAAQLMVGYLRDR